jgi:polysaccharide pyruvyl transferase WcaK-like protein
MSKKILLMDAFSTIHVGNGALLENTILLCKKAYGNDCKIAIISTDTETCRLKYSNLYENIFFYNYERGKSKFYKLKWLLKQVLFILMQIINLKTINLPLSSLPAKKIQKDTLEAIENADICISLFGEGIKNSTSKSLPFWLFTFWLAIQKKKDFIVFPQSIGPLTKNWAKKLVYFVLKDAKLIAGRDKPSFEFLQQLGFDKDKIMYVPDVAIQQQKGSADIQKYLKNKNKKIIGITISDAPVDEVGKKVNFIKEITPQIEKLDKDKYQILIMPSNYIKNGISKDYQLCLDLKERLSKTFEVGILENRPYFPDEYSALLSQLEFFVTTRMHVMILATTMYTPTIAIYTQHKIMGYMENINMEKYCIKYEKLNTIYNLSQEIIENRDAIVKKLKQENKKLKDKHQIFIKKLQEVVK